MIDVTEKAAEQIRRMMKEQSLDTATVGVRVGVKPAGCSGLTYAIDFEHQGREGDQILSFHGLRFYVDASSAPYLEEVRIDWNGGLLGSGFKFSNPNATRTCGCGESFSV